MKIIEIIITTLGIASTACERTNMIIEKGDDGQMEVSDYGQNFKVKSNGLEIEVVDKFNKASRVYAWEGYKIWVENNIIHGDGIISIDYSDNGYFGITKLEDGRWCIHHNEVEFEDYKREDGLQQYYKFTIGKDGNLK